MERWKYQQQLNASLYISVAIVADNQHADEGYNHFLAKTSRTQRKQITHKDERRHFIVYCVYLHRSLNHVFFIKYTI